MIRAAWNGAEDADAVVHLVDAQAHDRVLSGAANAADRLAVRDSEAIARGLASGGRQTFLALNKIDLVRKERLLAVTKALFNPQIYTEVFMISAQGGAGVADLRRALAARMPEGPWLYPAEQSADLPARLLAAEVTREKLYLRVHEELPYSAAVETTAFDERADGSVRIEQTIFVEREGQRAIVLGKGGAALKQIGQSAREELAAMLDRTVHLFLHVKVMRGWAEDRRLYGEVGLDFDV
jgi:GTP-binding protein Era